MSQRSAVQPTSSDPLHAHALFTQPQRNRVARALPSTASRRTFRRRRSRHSRPACASPRRTSRQSASCNSFGRRTPPSFSPTRHQPFSRQATSPPPAHPRPRRAAETASPSSPPRRRRLLRMEVAHNPPRQILLRLHGMQPAAGTSACIAAISLARRSVSSVQYFHISSSEMDISLPYISLGGSSMPMALPSDLDIFCTPSRPSRIGVISTICGGWPSLRCSSRPISRLNFWSVPPSSTSHSQRDRVVALRQRIQQLVHADGLLLLEALVEVLALQHLRDGELAARWISPA